VALNSNQKTRPAYVSQCTTTLSNIRRQDAYVDLRSGQTLGTLDPLKR
jgi:hypothetical protein